jgi:hypothetical protein
MLKWSFPGTLVNCILEAYENSGTPGAARRDQDSQARAYDSMVNQGKLSAAVRNLTNRNKGGVHDPCAYYRPSEHTDVIIRYLTMYHALGFV